MNTKEKRRLADKFGLKSWSGGTYEEGLFEGLQWAEKYYKKEEKKQ